MNTFDWIMFLLAGVWVVGTVGLAVLLIVELWSQRRQKKLPPRRFIITTNYGHRSDWRWREDWDNLD